MKALTFAGVALAALLAGAGLASAKTLVYCSEGSPENFTPAINTTGTSFDAARPVYNRLTEFKRGTTDVVPGLAESWEVTDGGKTITFHLRKGVKFHSLKDFKPTRDFNADDVLFSFDRQWKPDNPYYKVSGGKYDYFNDMDMPKLLDSLEKTDDYTVVMKLKTPECRHPRQSGDGLHGDRVEGIRRLPAQEGNARAVRPGAGRHRPVLVRLLSEGFRSSATRRTRTITARRRWSTTSCSPSRPTPLRATPNSRRASATSMLIQGLPTSRRWRRIPLLK